MAKKLTAWSYSRLALFEECPRLYSYRNIEKRKEPKADAMFRGIKIHNEAAAFLSGKTDSLPESCVQFAEQFHELKAMSPIVEQQWAFTKEWNNTKWFAKNVWFRATLDVLLQYSDDTADIIDHKTGKRYDDDYRKQMGLFAGAALIKYPNIRHFTTRLWYLDSGDEVIEEFTRVEALIIFEEIEADAKVMLNTTRFPPRPSWKCQFCHFRKNNGGPCEYG